MLLALAPSAASAASDATSQDVWLTGAAYGFSGHRGTELEFRLNTSTIRFKMNLDFDVLRWLQASQQTGAYVAVRIDPREGDFEGSSTDPTFPAKRIAIKGDLRNVTPGSEQPLIGRRPLPTPPSVRALAEAIVLRDSGQGRAAEAYLDTPLADSALRPALRAVALRTRAQLEEPVEPVPDAAPTPDGDRALMKSLAELDLAVSLAPEDADSANERSYVLARLGAYDEALAGFRGSPDAFRDVFRLGLAAQFHRWVGNNAAALADVEEMAKRHPNAGGMAYFYNRGEALLGLGRYHDAIKAFTQGLAAQPDFAGALIGRACAYARLGQLEYARTDLSRSVATTAAAVKAHSYARAAGDAIWLAGASKKLSDAISKNPHAPDDSPCLAEHPRARSPLLSERAVVPGK